jgi:hypothetical protein
VAGRGRNGEGPDETKAPVEAEVAFIPEYRNGELTGTAHGRLALRLGNPHRPARVDILLRRFGGVVWPDLRGCLTRLDGGLLGPGVARPRCRDQGSIDNLSASRQVAPCLQPLIEALKQPADGARLRQPLAEASDGVFVRRRMAQLKAEKP